MMETDKNIGLSQTIREGYFMKKLLAFALCLLLVLAMLPVASFASSDDDDDDDSYYEKNGIEASGTNVSIGRLSLLSWKYDELEDLAKELGATLNEILFTCEITDTDSGDKDIMFSLGDDYEEDEVTILYMHKDGTIDVIAAMCDETGDIELDTTSTGAAYMILNGPEYAAAYDSTLVAKKPGTYVTSAKSSGTTSSSSSPITVKPSTDTTTSTDTTGTQQEENPNTGIGTMPRFFLRLF